MKITKAHLKQIIKEEVVKLLVEQDEYDDDYEEEELTPAQKIIKLLSSTEPDYVDQGFTILDALEDQQLIDTIASYIVFRSNGRITIRGFKTPHKSFKISDETLEMILKYFAEKSDRFKDMLAQIENLVIYDNNFITNVDFLSFCTNLTSLELAGCESLQNVDGLEGCTNLTSLNLSECSSLENIDGLKGCTNLTTLDLSYCRSLQNVDGLQGLMNLTTLNLGSGTFTALQSRGALGVLKSLPNLTTLNLVNCRSLQNVDGLKDCTNLTTLDLRFCESLQNIDGLKECTNLTTLDLGFCSSLPPELQRWFTTDSSGTAYEQFIKALNASKGNQP